MNLIQNLHVLQDSQEIVQVMRVIFLLDMPTQGMLFIQVNISCCRILFLASLENGAHDASSFSRTFIYVLTIHKNICVAPGEEIILI